MNLAGILAAGRATAEARMSDSCVITRGGTPVWNSTTEQYDETDTTVYTGRCRVKMPGSMSLETDVGATERVAIRPEVHIPADVEGVAVGNRVTISSAAFNPSLTGSVFRVTSLFHDSQATAQRLDCTEEQ